ncbi:MAG: glycosyltransferase [Candidatus Eremiobacteraeota bacterium]|nr:glycosyltransferase [Candidatus Eremiobacteraeota bacterium]
MLKKETVSACIVTVASEDRLEKVVKSLRPVVDEVVVVIDTKSKDGTEEVARRCADRVEFVENDNWLAIYFPMFEHCKGSWILRIDDDETLCDSWSRTRMLQLIEAPGITNYYLPRKWIVPEERYICEPPLFPNFALRLFRNDRAIAGVPETVHSQLPISGPSGLCGDLNLLHWNLVIYDRTEREEKTARYFRTSPQAAAGAGEAYYLYEDFSYDTMPLSEPRTLNWEPGDPMDWPFLVDTRFAELPPLRAGRPIFLPVDVRNRSNRPWVVSPHANPHPNPDVCYAVQWFGADPNTHTIVQTEGPRTPAWLSVAPGEAKRALVQAQVPAVPGRYLIRTDIVAAGAGWFSSLRGSGDLAFKMVDVLADHPRVGAP